MLMETVMAQTNHLCPAGVAALLVQDGAEAGNDTRRTGLRFGGLTRGFGRAAASAKCHSLHWSSPDTMRTPAACFPLVGERLQGAFHGDLLRTVGERGSVSFFAPKKGQGCLLGVMQLVRGTDGIYRRNTVQLHRSWSFRSQLVSEEESGSETASNVMELFAKKLVLWVFGYFAMESKKQLTLSQLETAFPLITAVDVQERQRFVSEALARYAGGLLSFYDNRVITLSKKPVYALSLLSSEEFRMVTSMEKASVIFVYKCQMRHDEVLDALQTILDAWRKRGAVVASSAVRMAVAVLVSHIVGTCALPSHGLRGAIRFFPLRHMPMLLKHNPDSLTARLFTCMRAKKALKKSALVALQREMEEIMCCETAAVEPTAACGEAAATFALDDAHIFESVAPPPEMLPVVLWRIAKGTCRHTVLSLQRIQELKCDAGGGLKTDDIFSTALFSGARLQLPRKLLKFAVSEELCLTLNLGKAHHPTPDDEVVWETSRKRRRGRAAT